MNSTAIGPSARRTSWVNVLAVTVVILSLDRGLSDVSRRCSSVSLPMGASALNVFFGRSFAHSIFKSYLIYPILFDLLFNFFPRGHSIVGSLHLFVAHERGRAAGCIFMCCLLHVLFLRSEEHTSELQSLRHL